MERVDRYILTIQSQPKWTTPVAVRLKGVLKQLLRAWGFRCVSIEPVTEPSESEST